MQRQDFFRELEQFTENILYKGRGGGGDIVKMDLASAGRNLQTQKEAPLFISNMSFNIFCNPNLFIKS